MLLRHNVSLLRQSKVVTEYDPKRGVSVATLAYEYPSRFQVPEHADGSAILRNPADSKPMAILCSEAGVSVRTIERAFRKDVGTSFESWRRQARLTKAVELLVSG